jgi:hypothetical protein
MRNPEYNDAVTPYSKADRVIIRASLNQSRLDSKKSSAKKAVAKKPVAKKAAAPKPTDSRFSGVKKPSATKPTDSRFMGMGAGKPKSSGSMSYTAGSAKNNSTKYTTGPGIPARATTKKAAPAQKTKPRFGGFSMLADSLTKKNPKAPKAPKAVTGRRTSGSK